MLLIRKQIRKHIGLLKHEGKMNSVVRLLQSDFILQLSRRSSTENVDIEEFEDRNVVLLLKACDVERQCAFQ